MMSRTPAAQLLATGSLALLMVVVPLWTLSRVTGGLAPVQASDVILMFGLAGWIVCAKAIIDRDDQLNSLAVSRTSARWHAQRLVDHSVLGPGLVSSTDLGDTSRLHLLARPQQLSAAQLPPALAPVGFADNRHEPAVVAGGVATTHADDPAPTSVGELREYRVSRGDTFWSISAAMLGDGRDWQHLQALNLGRQVAPEVILTTKHELRIGWSILVPVVAANDLVDADNTGEI